MKTQINAFNKYFSVMFKRLGVSSNWLRAFGHQKSLMGYLSRLPLVLLGHTGRTWVLGTIAFAKFALKLKSHSGFKGLAITLKVAHTLIVKSVAGQPIKDVASSLGHRVGTDSHGIPRFIPLVHRRLIHRGDGKIIQFYSSLCSLYRVLDFRGKIKLSTITQPGPTYDLQPYIDFISVFFHRLLQFVEIPKFSKWQPKFILKSGPGVVSAQAKKFPLLRPVNSTIAMVYTAMAWKSPQFATLYTVLKQYARLTNANDMVLLIEEINRWAVMRPQNSKWVPTYLGKLGLKEEPGKVRVFAMVDWWTQMLLRPLHLLLQEVLKQIPTDATFDQERGILEGIEIMKRTNFGASRDLSAATDRLPINLQSRLVDFILPGLGKLWAELLIGRAYSVPWTARRWGMKIPLSVTYAVGQPMGALSSWVMLALTHHFIVQMAAYRAGYVTWFKDYLVLGDDITIFNRDVDLQYCAILSDLGVQINLVKSVVSTTSFEFAKRFVHKGVNLSPVSFKEMDVASANLDGALTLFSRFWGGHKYPISALARFHGSGYRVTATLDRELSTLSKFWSSLVVYVSRPGLGNYSSQNWLEWFSISALNKFNFDLNLQSLSDKLRAMIPGWKPSRLKDAKLILSGPELGAGLRPDPDTGVLRFARLSHMAWTGKFKPRPEEEKVLYTINRVLYRAFLETDLDKRQINELWKDLEIFWEFDSPDNASQTLDRLMDTLVFVAAREADPTPGLYKPELVPRQLAPRLLRLHRKTRKI